MEIAKNDPSPTIRKRIVAQIPMENQSFLTSVAENDGDEYIAEGKDINQIIDELTVEMLSYAEKMEFEKAAEIRDKIKTLEELK